MTGFANLFDPQHDAAIVTGAGNGIGRAIALVSDRISGYVTGASIVVDGGLALTNWFEPPDFSSCPFDS